jgi:hypothetical protein
VYVKRLVVALIALTLALGCRGPRYGDNEERILSANVQLTAKTSPQEAQEIVRGCDPQSAVDAIEDRTNQTAREVFVGFANTAPEQEKSAVLDCLSSNPAVEQVLLPG